MRAKEFILESTGLAGRKPGDKFTNAATGETLTFNSIQFFPDGGGKYNPEELEIAIGDAENSATKQGSEINWENSKSPRTGGFAVATFTNDKNQQIFTGRYLEQVKPNPTDNYVPNDVLKGQYKFGGKAAVKIQSNLSPQDLLSNKQDLSISDIMNQLAQSLGTSNPLYAVAHHIASGESLPFTFPAPQGVSFTAFRDYFCEILQPMALKMGQYTGNAGEAADIFLKPQGFAGAAINYGGGKNEGLQDSSFSLPDGRYVKVSSKGGQGATASAKNLLDTVNELKDSKLRKKYNEVITMLEEIVKYGQAGSPLYLGTKFKIIDSDEAKIVQGLKASKPVDLTQPNIDKTLKGLGLTDNLISKAKTRGTDNPKQVYLYYHLIAQIAAEAANKVNTETNFSEAAADILNNGALVQVYTKASESKDNWTLNEFKTVYPGTAVSGVLFTPSKTYYSTGIKGNFTFKILS